MSCFQAFDSLCRKIVCPSRHILDQDQIIERKFKSTPIKYCLLKIKNLQQKQLSVIVFQKDFQKYPTILYLHGNGGHKMEALQIVRDRVNLVAFDFQGCGNSQGDYVTYGLKQVGDIHEVVTQIKLKYPINKFFIWGRSMGASLALLYAATNPRQITALILDTPFRTLKKVVYNVAQHNSRSVPNILLNIAVYFIQKKTEGIVGANIFQIDFLKSLQNINTPILFVYSSRDTVVKQQDVRELYDAYQGQKCITKIQSLHHQDRPKAFIDTAYQFIQESSKSMQQSMHSLRESKYSYSKKKFINPDYSNDFPNI